MRLPGGEYLIALTASSRNILGSQARSAETAPSGAAGGYDRVGPPAVPEAELREPAAEELRQVRKQLRRGDGTDVHGHARYLADEIQVFEDAALGAGRGEDEVEELLVDTRAAVGLDRRLLEEVEPCMAAGRVDGAGEHIDHLLGLGDVLVGVQHAPVDDLPALQLHEPLLLLDALDILA